MRTETEVHKREVLAIWVKSCMSQVLENYSNLTAAMKQTDMGKNGTFCILQVLLCTLPKEQTTLGEAVLQFFWISYHLNLELN